MKNFVNIWYALTLLLISGNCIDPLGMEDGRIPDASLTDDVDLQYSYPENARLNKEISNFPFGWMASIRHDEWLQIDLGSNHKVDSVFAEAVTQRCSGKNLFLKTSQNSQGNTCLRPATLLKKRLQHSCFPVNFVKFLRTHFLTDHLQWLIPYFAH